MKNRILFVNIFRYSNEIIFAILFCKVDLTRLSHFGKVFDIQFKALTNRKNIERQVFRSASLSYLLSPYSACFIVADYECRGWWGWCCDYSVISDAIVVMLSQLLLLFCHSNEIH